MHRTMDGQGKSVQHRAPGAHLAVPFPHRGQKDPMFMPLFFRRTSAHCV